MAELSLILAFAAGIISFFSPCVVPLIPGFLGYLAGAEQGKASRSKLFLHSLAYVTGFTVVFSTLGILLNTVLASASYDIQTWLARIGGTIIILFGLHLLGFLPIPWLEVSHKPSPTRSAVGYGTSFLFGASFAVGWTPCVGPVLGSVLALAASNPGSAFGLLLLYSIGLGVPFLVVGLFSTQALALIRRSSKFLIWFNRVVGVVLIVLGILVFTGLLARVSGIFVITGIGG